MLAQGVSDMRMLPPGTYFARAQVKSGTALIGEVRRAVHADEARCRRRPTPRWRAGAAGPSPVGSLRPPTAARVAAVPPFAIEQSPRRRCSTHSSIASRRGPTRRRR